MHDTNLLQLIIDDFAPAQQLLELLQNESLALHGRDMPLLEEILARKQALIILLEQHGRKRSEILASLNLPTNRQGLEQLASQSSIGDQLLSQSDVLTDLIAQCQAANVNNGQSILVQQAATANQLKILTGGEPPALYDASGTFAKPVKPRTFSQA
ncbi:MULTISPECIES: flagella synthesis protein FlgN [Pseudomonas]|jgi:flagella synthesis protein FlgN|uniref:Flagellar protein FlgN n=1 Tax=Pseudomonas monsensis TaxID=2745509 RepID=A0ABT3YVH6_9PSED|nr:MULTISPECIES: flagellar protein FlgN [Pseudomonas]PTT60902.1 flagellar biosynthesis protein FlgN [Pseudomonas sp. HMWF007]PTT83393.1 flagellar biosynthesis protein FlgN [Pseudomonas sp. HMWF005]RON62805.1 flagellar biosynthesis protein FlgN [Pseudomonas fluorescens]MCY0109508.1 flagellar protein FlgN [Pseudomonas monsensis]MDZ3829477.1 flagellar protein FlgN [Pseudomonas monsensis]